MMLFAAALESPGGRRAAACCVICKDAEHLVACGAGCFAFDFSGHGDNIGHLREVRLLRRSPRAKSAPQVMSQRPTVLIEASMRGHVASNIVADVEPEFLILFCLALFGNDSIDLPFASARPQPSGSHRVSSIRR